MTKNTANTNKNLLGLVQSELKAPKGQYNNFGKYNYRSTEDIVEAAKPILKKYDLALILSDEVIMLGEGEHARFYIKATAALRNSAGEVVSQSFALAREPENKKGMDASQITGAASSYARKYALNGLLAIDDTKDADSDEHANAADQGNGKVSKLIEQGLAIADVDKLTAFYLKHRGVGGEFEKQIAAHGQFLRKVAADEANSQ